MVSTKMLCPFEGLPAGSWIDGFLLPLYTEFHKIFAIECVTEYNSLFKGPSSTEDFY